MKKKKIIGLTGPIASGKNEVAKILQGLGAYVIDADKIGHTVRKTSPAIQKKLLKAFGKQILNSQKKICSKRLGRAVFGDPKALKKLNKIMHPAMKKTIKSRVVRLGSRVVVINAAVLKEMKLIPLVDEVWVVLSSRKERLKRLMREGLSKQDALKRIKSQRPNFEYLKMADVVVRNDSSLAELREFLSKLTRLI